jgi:deoxyribodipyrimidine photo-lyase
VDSRRVRLVKDGQEGRGPVAYWMSRDQRVRDNWALFHAQKLALQKGRGLEVFFCLKPGFPGAGLRHYAFMLRGLREVSASLGKLSIPFHLLEGDPPHVIPDFCDDRSVGVLVTDFSPLKIKAEWTIGVAEGIEIPIQEVDAHNVVPCWVASQKAEYGAYTIRPKIASLLDEFLTRIPAVKPHSRNAKPQTEGTDWSKVLERVSPDREVPEVAWVKPGEEAAASRLRTFLRDILPRYSRDRNDPNGNGQSELSPYLHYGQLSAQRVALSVSRSKVEEEAKSDFLEELVVRRELSDNFCFHNPSYDRFQGFPEWARKTLNEHRSDPREYDYSLRELEEGRTHDDLWNAAQREMVVRGKMHGYMRMFWAKKILEWTEFPEAAMEAAITLNDRYELDGRDPNGYTGVAWSIGGVHDRAWRERPVFGKIRYMNRSGCERKFDVPAYIDRISGMEPRSIPGWS